MGHCESKDYIPQSTLIWNLFWHKILRVLKVGSLGGISCCQCRWEFARVSCPIRLWFSPFLIQWMQKSSKMKKAPRKHVLGAFYPGAPGRTWTPDLRIRRVNQRLLWCCTVFYGFSLYYWNYMRSMDQISSRFVACYMVLVLLMVAVMVAVGGTSRYRFPPRTINTGCKK